MISGPILCLDGGRSGCRARLHPGADDSVEGHGPPEDPVEGHGLPDDPVERHGSPDDPVEVHGGPLPAVRATGGVTAVLAALDALVAALPSHRADVVVAGLAGLRVGSAHAPALAAALAARTGARRVVVTGDLVTGYVGALGLEPGVVVSAGTGSVAFALGQEGRTARAGGWGHLLGDEGSGFWVGRAGLAAALAHHDGRGTGSGHSADSGHGTDAGHRTDAGRGAAALAARAEAVFGPLDDLPDQLEDRDAVARVAAFAPEVAAAAREGDPVAFALWEQAGRALAAAAVAAADRALGAEAAAVSWTGGLFAAGELLLEPFRAELRQRAPHLRLRPPAGSALDGAHRLARVVPVPPGLGFEHVTR